MGDCTLDKLHEHIQTAMGWTNSHLHHFRIDGTLYGDPMLMEETFGELNYADSTRTRLSDILPEGGWRFRFEYEYDFGDGWLHEVLFEGRLPAEPGKRYPLCLEGDGPARPRTWAASGGTPTSSKRSPTPSDEQHEEMREWVGRKFDPEAFNPAKATRRMKRAAGLAGDAVRTGTFARGSTK